MTFTRRIPLIFAFACYLLLIMKLFTANTFASEPYCGVYCVYTSARALNHSVDFEFLLNKKYVVGWEGSSISSLAEAASDLGLASQTLNGLSLWDLRIAPAPIILHVRSAATRPHFDHWVTYLGEINGKARIIDPTHGEQLIEYSDVLAGWDGAGIIISNSNIAIQTWRLIGWVLRLSVFVVVGCVLSGTFQFVLRVLPKGGGGYVSDFGKIGLTASVLVVLGITLDCLTGSRVLSNSYASRTVANLYIANGFKEISTHELASMLEMSKDKDGVQLIDARMTDDFSFSPLPGAINVPVNCASAYEAEAVSRIDLNKPLVVYCQSRSCSYSEHVSKRLSARGFKNIRIYAEGVIGWNERGNFASNKLHENRMEKGTDE